MNSRKRADRFLTHLLELGVLFGAINASPAPPSTLRALTLTNLEGRVYSNITVLKVDRDGILFRYADGYRYGGVKFTNLPPGAQLLFTPDLKETTSEPETKIPVRLPTPAPAPAPPPPATLEPGQSMRLAADKIYALSANDFPRDTNAVRICRQIVRQLTLLRDEVGQGITYEKYKDLAADTATNIGLLREDHPGLLPARFTAELEMSLFYFDTARDWWERSIKNDFIKAQCEHQLHKNWKAATLALTYCLAIAEQRTNIQDNLTDQVIELLVTDEIASRKKLNFDQIPDPALDGLDEAGMRDRFRQYLKTNVPALPK